MGIVYHLFCTFNGKAYVGQTWYSINERFEQHKRCKSLIGNAIRKYGEENFVKTVIFSSNMQDHLDSAEDAFIVEMNTISPNGYNLKRGGSHGKFSEEAKRKMSLAKKGKKNPNLSVCRKGKSPWNKGLKNSISDLTREKMSKAAKGRKSPRKGVKLSAATIEKLRKSHLGNTPSEETRLKMSKAQAEAWKVRR